eukprot:scaffold14073_cov15-Tisochrysis_lutea.AAC.1
MACHGSITAWPEHAFCGCCSRLCGRTSQGLACGKMHHGIVPRDVPKRCKDVPQDVRVRGTIRGTKIHGGGLARCEG